LKTARQTYNRLWHEAIPRFKRGEPQTDPHLNDRMGDGRRGVTLALRPEPAVQKALDLFMRQLADVAPGQYFYRLDELHVTVLAVIPGSEAWREKIHDLAAIHAVTGKVLKRRRPFAISFRGITASPSAVMIQGFPQGGALAEIRDELRRVLRKNHLGGDIDRRYKINTAHITVMRFGHARADWKAFVDLLKANRQTDFGETRVRKLQLLWGDWYASAQSVRTIQEYPLADPSRSPA
jgi:2'-5' RNA ligase